MVRCPHCEAALASGARYCLDCGRPVDDAVDLGETLPASSLQRFAGMALSEDTVLDPGAARGGTGPTDLLRQARVGVSGPIEESAPPASIAVADTVDPLPGAPASISTPDGSNPPPEMTPTAPPPPPQARSAPPEPGPEASNSPPPVAAPAPIQDRVSRPPRPGDPPEIGEVVDGFVIEEELGRGGMGRVYKARHGVTGQHVALKMLHPQVATGRARERFINEARMLARLEHPNLVPLLGFIDLPRGLFIQMPYVRGITLESMLRKQGRLSIDVAEPLFSGLCAGVGHIHSHGMLHRDLKPGNVIVQGDGTARLTDFGIAREIGAQGLTATGLVVGTAEYIAPEQANGTLRDDPRSDQYSLGCLLYHMLVGQPPFRHPNIGQLLVKHIKDPPPPPRGIVPELAPEVENVVLKALAKHPEHRFADVETMRQALLRAAAKGRSARPAPRPETTPEAPSGRGRWLAIGVVLALAYAIAAGLWWWLSRS